MRLEELRELSDEELVQKLKDAKVELFNLRFQLATGQLDNPLRIREARREIARVTTIKRERELTAEREPAAEREKAEA